MNFGAYKGYQTQQNGYIINSFCEEKIKIRCNMNEMANTKGFEFRTGSMSAIQTDI